MIIVCYIECFKDIEQRLAVCNFKISKEFHPVYPGGGKVEIRGVMDYHSRKCARKVDGIISVEEDLTREF